MISSDKAGVQFPDSEVSSFAFLVLTRSGGEHISLGCVTIWSITQVSYVSWVKTHDTSMTRIVRILPPAGNPRIADR